MAPNRDKSSHPSRNTQGRSGSSVDRRVRKTRTALQQALVSLMLEKGYDAVTLQEILERADVGRSTFYAHFSDKDELLVAGLSELEVQLTEAIRTDRVSPRSGADRVVGLFAGMLTHAASHRHLYAALIGQQAGTFVQQHVRRIVGRLVRTSLKGAAPRAELSSLSRDMCADWIVATMMSLMGGWLDSGDADITEHELARAFEQLLTRGMFEPTNSRAGARGR